MTCNAAAVDCAQSAGDPEFIQRYIAELEHAARSGGYQVLQRSVSELASRVLKGVSGCASVQFHRRVLARLVEVFPAGAGAISPPAVFDAPLARHRARMSALIDVATDDYFSLDNDRYIKDLAICLGRMIPAGAELIDPFAGLPRRVLIRGGLSQLMRASKLYLANRGVLAPFCELHMHLDDLAEFSPRGWVSTYLRVAELMRNEPRLRGLFGTAWFYDPAVAEISPHLSYLREYRVQRGAVALDWGPTPAATSAALRTSETRRLAYAQGRYQPRTYYLIWPRRALLAWSDSMREKHGQP